MLFTHSQTQHTQPSRPKSSIVQPSRCFYRQPTETTAPCSFGGRVLSWSSTKYIQKVLKQSSAWPERGGCIVRRKADGCGAAYKYTQRPTCSAVGQTKSRCYVTALVTHVRNWARDQRVGKEQQ